jgi:hypothetical protein
MDLVYCDQLKINSPEAMQGFFAKHIVSLGRKILNANTPATFIRCLITLYYVNVATGMCSAICMFSDTNRSDDGVGRHEEKNG